MPPPEFVHYVVLDVPNITQSTTFVGIFGSLSGLEVSFDVYEYGEGGNNDFVHRLPGRMHYPNLVLSWGLVQNDLLLKWFSQTHVEAQRQEITLTLTASKGDMTKNIRTFTFTDAFPVRWTGPQITEGGVGTWGETLEIAHSGLKLP
jgi:phage tail-like protein